jgi:hypothetical protein
MIALYLTSDVVLAGIAVPAHRTLEVVDELPSDEPEGERTVLTAGEARALVQAGYAQPVTADFEALEASLHAWRQ